MSDAPTTLRFQVHLARPSHSIVLRDGPRPSRATRGRVPRVARLLALAHHFQRLLDESVVETQAELAELARLTRPRITQILNLLLLAPDIQEQILFLPRATTGATAITEHTLRYVVATPVWAEQRKRWAELQNA